MTPPKRRVLYCHCAYARVVPPDVKQQVLSALAASGLAFDAVPDLCEMSARKDPRLKELAAGEAVQIAACYPRAVKWLFAAAGAPVDERVQVLNMREQPAAEVLHEILGAR